MTRYGVLLLIINNDLTYAFSDVRNAIKKGNKVNLFETYDRDLF